MAIILTTGMSVHIASSYGPPVAITSISNSPDSSTPAVATVATGHGVVEGDFIEITSGWGRISQSVVRVSDVSTNDLTLEKVYTHKTDMYPAGKGGGSMRRVLTRMEVTQVTEITSSGGEVEKTDVTVTTDVVKKEMPTVRGTMSGTLKGLYDNDLPWVKRVEEVSDSIEPCALFIYYANGSITVSNTYWNMNPQPEMAINSPLRSNISFSYLGKPFTYGKFVPGP